MKNNAQEIIARDSFRNVILNVFKSGEARQARRFVKLYNGHEKYFSCPPDAYFSSPGRIEIVGNHTDHNGGKVLCAAINCDTLAAVSKRDDGKIFIKSGNYPFIRLSVDDVELKEKEYGTSLAIVKGVVKGFLNAGKCVGGFNACVVSDVPKGAGVSSSSSFELLIAEILNVFFNGGKLDPVFKAKVSQYSENVYFGKPSGLMDQSAISLGGVNLIDFSDIENLKIKPANWQFNDLDVYVIATGGDHSDLTADYAQIPADMKEVANILSKNLLCEVDDWDEKKTYVKGRVSERAYLRAEHFFEENERVAECENAVECGDESKFLECVTESGLSSRYKLKNTYSEKAGDKSLENALDEVVKIDGVKAARVHGGGFAGTILVFADKRKGVNVRLINKFGKRNVFKLAIREYGAIKLDVEIIK